MKSFHRILVIMQYHGDYLLRIQEIRLNFALEANFLDYHVWEMSHF